MRLRWGPGGMSGREGTLLPPHYPKIARFVPICAMEDIGIKDDWEAAQWVFILIGVPKAYGRFHGERALGHPRPTNVNNI